MRQTLTLSGIMLSALLVTAPAFAQDSTPPQHHHSAVQLAFQGRINAMGYLAPDRLAALQTITPYVTPGVRLIDGRLFLGLGIGFGAFSSTTCEDTCDDYTTRSQSYFALSPMAFFDILRAGPASLYAGGWFSIAPIGSATTEIKVGSAGVLTTTTDGGPTIGVNLAVGIRAQIVEGLAIGTEWGWGLASYSNDGDETGENDDTTTTMHGIFGTIMVEGAIDL